MRFRPLLKLLALLVFAVSIAVAPAMATPVAISFGPSVMPLNGPWKFHTGDDARWAAQDFDDGNWETVDLTPKPGAHDGDVGLRNYVPGWQAKGHRGYTGFAWYRMAVRVAAPGADTLWLAGPASVDNGYQLYFNGRLIGGIGDFARTPPAIVSTQPRMFALPRVLWTARNGELSGVIAFRVALIKGLLAGPDSGGIHIAPLLGNEMGVGDHTRLEWLQAVEGYTVDAIEPILFLFLAIMALSILKFDPHQSFYPWLAAALILLAAARANQPLYFLGQFETMWGFAFWRLTVIDPLALAAWAMAWRARFGLQSERWIAIACAVLAAAYMVSRYFGTSLLSPELPHAAIVAFASIVQWTRYGFLALFCYLAYRGIRIGNRGTWFAIPALLSVGIGLFAQELSLIGVPGIWFPFGVGVSRTEYAYIALDVLLFLYLLYRLWQFAPRRSGDAPVDTGNAD
jgi:hypothetical protein